MRLPVPTDCACDIETQESPGWIVYVFPDRQTDSTGCGGMVLGIKGEDQYLRHCVHDGTERRPLHIQVGITRNGEVVIHAANLLVGGPDVAERGVVTEG